METEIQQLYIRYFGRPADYAGLDFWSASRARGATLDAIKNGFEKSPEFLSLYAGKPASEVVSRAYDFLFGRVPDAAGMSFWAGHLQAGRLSLNNILDVIISSAVVEDKFAFNSRISSAIIFTNALRENAVSFSDSFQQETGRSWLRQVGSTKLSQDLANQQIAILVTRLNGREPGLVNEEVADAFKAMLKAQGNDPTLRIYYNKLGVNSTRLDSSTLPIQMNNEMLDSLRSAFGRVDSLAGAFRLLETEDLQSADIEVHAVQSLEGGSAGLTTTRIRTDSAASQKTVYSRIDVLNAFGTDAQYLASHEVLHAFGGEHPFDFSDGDGLLGTTTADTMLSYEQNLLARQTGYSSIFTPLDEAVLRQLYS